MALYNGASWQAVSESERLIVVADTFNHRIQKLTFTGQCVHEYLGYLFLLATLGTLGTLSTDCSCRKGLASAALALRLHDGAVGTAHCAGTCARSGREAPAQPSSMSRTASRVRPLRLCALPPPSRVRL